MPIGEADTFRGIIDLLTMKAEIYKDDMGTQIEITDIPAELKAKAEQLRSDLIEKVVETDDALLERYFEGEEISLDEIKKAIRKATISKALTPVLCGS